MKAYNLILKKISVAFIILSSLIVSNFAVATSCPTVVSSCSNTSQEKSGNPCSDYFLGSNASSASGGVYTYDGSGTTEYTYCDSCGACDNGVSDCVSGDCGCNKCDTGTTSPYTYTGTLCSGSGVGSCSNGGGSITCTSNSSSLTTS